jgi:hypothetical protein
MARKKTAKRKTTKKRRSVAKPAPRKRRLLRSVLLLLGIGVGILIPWLIYLDVAVTRERAGNGIYQAGFTRGP